MERTYRVPRSQRRSFGAVAILIMLAGLMPVAFLVKDSRSGVPPEMDRIAMLCVAALVLVGLGAWTLFFVLIADRFTVTTTDEAITVGKAAPLRWSEIDGLRQRPRLQRLDLLGHGGRLASIEYQLEDLAGLIEEIRSRVHIDDSELPRRIERPKAIPIIAATLTICAALIAGSIWLWRSEQWIGVVVLLLIAATLAFGVASETLAMDIGESELRLKRVLRSKSIPRDAIAAIRLVVAPSAFASHQLKTAVELRDGRKEWIVVRGVDPNVIYDALRRYYPQV